MAGFEDLDAVAQGTLAVVILGDHHAVVDAAAQGLGHLPSGLAGGHQHQLAGAEISLGQRLAHGGVRLGGLQGALDNLVGIFA